MIFHERFFFVAVCASVCWCVLVFVILCDK
jgi:hypothetical protein